MSTIRETVEQNLASGYVHYATNALNALEEREAEAIEVMRNFALDKGLSEDEFNEVLIEAGLREPEPEPETVVPQGDLTVEEQISALTAQVANLTTTVNTALEAARRQGVHI